ncbi:MAG: pyridoxal phosphate-dependent aminotransferase [Chitinophagaceae bacterium]|nr:MAG: pyridoxal phosphate-dependent aminotransferase [Chitinophagaceae bacterium]
MQHLSKRILDLEESATIRMAQLARKLKSEGRDIISLSLGEPDFNTPEYIGNAAKKAIDEGYTHYTPVAGYAELRKAISDKLLRDNGLSYDINQIVSSTGAKQSLMNAILCLVESGDEVIVPSPYWVSYAAMIQLAEGKMINIPTTVESAFKITPEQLENAITPKSKLLMLCSPSNPTGAVYSESELRSLAEVLKKYPQIIIISDEIYEYITFETPHFSIAQIEGMYERTAIVNGVSKGFAMTGWRLGFLAAPEWLAKACDKIQGQFTSGTSSISQKAAEAAFTENLDEVYAMRDKFKERRDLVLDKLNAIDGLKISIPQGAFYVFPDISAFFGKKSGDFQINSSEDFCMYILDEANVSLVAGSAFGDDNCVRISYANSEENLRKALDKISAALAKLK